MDVSIKHTGRLTEASLEPSVGSVDDIYDNTLPETVIGLFKTKVIHRRGQRRGLEPVESATLEWIDWFITRRLKPIDHIPPIEAEARRFEEVDAAAVGA